MDSLAIVLIVAVAILLFIASESRGVAMLSRWAEREELTIVESSHSFWPGPFWLTAGKGSIVYRIVVADSNGRRRSGYAKCGSWLGGVWFSEHVTVIWDDDSAVDGV